MGSGGSRAQPERLSRRQVTNVENLFNELDVQLRQGNATQRNLLRQQRQLNNRANNQARQAQQENASLLEQMLSAQQGQLEEERKAGVLGSIIAAGQQKLANNYNDNTRSAQLDDYRKASGTAAYNQQSLLSVLTRSRR